MINVLNQSTEVKSSKRQKLLLLIILPNYHLIYKLTHTVLTSSYSAGQATGKNGIASFNLVGWLQIY